MTRTFQSRILLSCVLGSTLLATGCTREGKFQAYSMWNESRIKPMEGDIQPDRASSAHELIPGTVARGKLRVDTVMYQGRNANGTLVTRIPFAVNQEVLLRGQERFNIYCSPCHSANGDGKGMVVKRGFTQPPDYAIARLRTAPVGHFYDVITNGYGAMYSYASRVQPNDRWAIAAYIRVLQQARPVVPDTRPQTSRPPAGRPGGPGAGRSVMPGSPTFPPGSATGGPGGFPPGPPVSTPGGEPGGPVITPGSPTPDTVEGQGQAVPVSP